MKKIFDRFLYNFIKIFFKSIAYTYFRLGSEGKENIPGKAPFIVASNHASFLDPVAVQIAFPIDINWVAKKAVMEKTCLWPLHYLWRSIPVNGAVDKAVAALEEGRVVGIFPEGTRTDDGTIKNGDVGVAVMALKTGLPVVPVCVKGSYEAFGRGKVLPRPHRIIVKIGKPFSLERIDKDEIEKSVLEERKDYIMNKLRELL